MKRRRPPWHRPALARTPLLDATTIKGYQDTCRLKIEDAKKKLAEKP